jgi:hypothetical protein
VKENIIPATAEVRTVEPSESDLRRTLEASEEIGRSAVQHGRLKQALTAVWLHNIHEPKVYRILGFKKWDDYLQSRHIAETTARRYLQSAQTLLKKCSGATRTEGSSLLFDEKKIEKAIIKLSEKESLTLSDLIAEYRQIESHFSPDGNILKNDDVMSLLLEDETVIESPEDDEAADSFKAHYDPFLKAYADEQGLKYDKVRGWINGDGTDLTEQQRTDMTSYQAALKAPELVGLGIAKLLKEIEEMTKKHAESYRLYLGKGYPKFSEQASEHFKGARMAELRLSIYLEAMEFGETDKAMKALTASADEVLKMSNN